MKITNTTESDKVNHQESDTSGHTELSPPQSPQQLAFDLEAYVRNAAAAGMPLHEVEPIILDRVLRIGHACVDQLLALQGNGDLGETVSTEDDRTLYRSEQPQARPLRTVFGLHSFSAYVYSAGSHRTIELRPIDARLQLPAGRGSYLFEEFSQYFCIDQAFGQSAGSLHTVLQQKVSVDTLQQINRRMGEQATRFLDTLPTPPVDEEGAILVFTGDGKGVPLVQEDAQALPVFEEAPERPGNRRMSTVVSVYSVDAYRRTPEQFVAALFRDESEPRPEPRPEPQFKHLRARFAQCYADDAELLWVSGPTDAFAWAAVQVERRRRPGQPLVRLMDGQESLWNAADTMQPLQRQEATAILGETIDILDILHVSSYVWRAAKVFQSSKEHQEAFARERLLRILRGEVRGVIAGLRQMATKRKLRGTARREITTVCGYFEKHADRMRYDEYLRAGYPISTGVIEGACRHLVKDRMERSGMRWRLGGAQAMLEVRAVYQSSYWKEFHVARIAEEQRHLNPHRHLIADYAPYALAL